MPFGHKINQGEIIIKDVDILVCLMERTYFPLLIRIISEVAKEFGVVITEAWREEIRPGDVHTRCRAIDLRSWCYSEKIAYKIMMWINNRWEYDPVRPKLQCAMIHRVGNGKIHFHIQVHPNTRLR